MMFQLTDKIGNKSGLYTLDDIYDIVADYYNEEGDTLDWLRVSSIGYEIESDEYKIICIS